LIERNAVIISNESSIYRCIYRNNELITWVKKIFQSILILMNF